MTGLPNYNREFLLAAEARVVSALNVHVWNPARLNEDVVYPWTWENIMRRNIAALLVCDTLIKIEYQDRYFKHKGTLLEHRIASDLGMQIIPWEVLLTHIEKVEATHETHNSNRE